MNAITKQTWLATCNVIATVILAAFLLILYIWVPQNFRSIVAKYWSYAIQVFFATISICLWLSFAFAQKEYDCLCKICDRSCQVCCKTMAIKQIAAQQERKKRKAKRDSEKEKGNIKMDLDLNLNETKPDKSIELKVPEIENSTLPSVSVSDAEE